MAPNAERDAARSSFATQGLTPEAVSHLTRDALGRIDLDQLAPVKGLLKRFFSDQPWTDADDTELAERVGPGEGWWRHELAGGAVIEFGWRAGPFALDVMGPPDDADAIPVEVAPPVPEDAFSGSVIPEATPNPRTIRFVTGAINAGPSRWYASEEVARDAAPSDPRAVRLFTEFDDVANVLVGPDFVAVGIHRPDRWEHLLLPMLRVIAAIFPSTELANGTEEQSPRDAPGDAVDVRGGGPPRKTSLADAWNSLSRLSVDRPDELDAILRATSSPDVATRQVAARRLIEADPETASTTWRRLLDDPSRTVRRATVDVMVDAERETLRPLLERALHDADAWIRWKALRGLADLGIEPSHDAVVPLTGDADFRVRLEASGALRPSRET